MRRTIVTLLLLAPGQAWCWGDEGHQTVARIAAAHLTERARQAVANLLKQDATFAAPAGAGDALADAMARAAMATEGSMVALMGGDEGARDALATLDEVWVANINGANQIVVSGTRSGLDAVLARHRELGWRRATPLNVGGAFHSPLMDHAQEELDEVLDSITWGETEATLIANVDGLVHTKPAEWRDLLSRQLTSPVLFLDATLTLPATVTTTIEMPPGGVLTGLTKRIRPFETQLAPVSLDDLQEITI